MLEKIKENAKVLKRDIPAIYLALKDKRTSLIAKVLCLMVVVYALSPIDLIPDFIPVIGYLDDLVILPLLIYLVLKLVPIELIDEYRNTSINLNKKWYYAIPFVLIWIVILGAILI